MFKYFITVNLFFNCKKTVNFVIYSNATANHMVNILIIFLV